MVPPVGRQHHCGGRSGHAERVEAFLPCSAADERAFASFLSCKLSPLSPSCVRSGQMSGSGWKKPDVHHHHHRECVPVQPDHLCPLRPRCRSLCTAPPATPSACFLAPYLCVTSVVESRVCLSEGGCHTIMTRGCAEMKSSLGKHAPLILNSLGRSCDESFSP